MKKFLLCILFILFLAPNAAANFYFLGLESSWIKKADLSEVVIGAASSVFTHFLGHMGYAYLEELDVTISYEWGTQEVLHRPFTNSQARNFARAGFVVQHAATIFLTSLEKTKDTDFAKGFKIATTLETLAYPICFKGQGDFHMIDCWGGNGDRDWEIFSSLVIYDLFRIEW